MPSCFITFEGPEGSGKSTQARMLAERLQAESVGVTLTREPGGDPVSEQIRKILLDGADHSIASRTELLLYLAARAEHTERVVRPSLADGNVVICDRYTDSTVAYQGYAGGIPLPLIHEMNSFATGGLVPDLTLLFDIDVETGLRRQTDWNRMERKDVEYHERVRRGFLEEARLNPGRIVALDAGAGIQEIHQAVLRIVAARTGLAVGSEG